MNILFQISNWIGLDLDDLCVVSISHGTEVAGIPKINIDTVERSWYL